MERHINRMYEQGAIGSIALGTVTQIAPADRARPSDDGNIREALIRQTVSGPETSGHVSFTSWDLQNGQVEYSCRIRALTQAEDGDLIVIYLGAETDGSPETVLTLPLLQALRLDRRLRLVSDGWVQKTTQIFGGAN